MPTGRNEKGMRSLRGQVCYMDSGSVTLYHMTKPLMGDKQEGQVGCLRAGGSWRTRFLLVEAAGRDRLGGGWLLVRQEKASSLSPFSPIMGGTGHQGSSYPDAIQGHTSQWLSSPGTWTIA